ncbi:hypothetical protein EPN81_01015 [Patescibacteria group bacterium]|nr:MAG: hypothetical protein EPN81_01015 [Patescibacteria group bacterium]
METIITLAELSVLANERFGDLVKAVVNVKNGSMVVGCELHVDAEQLLLQKGARQQDLWGINLYPDAFEDLERFVEFDSMINLRPGQGNRSRGVEDPNIREKILKIVRQKVVKN